MLKLVAVCGFLTIALSFDFGGMDEATYESALRDQGFSEEDIQTFLQVYYNYFFKLDATCLPRVKYL